MRLLRALFVAFVTCCAMAVIALWVTLGIWLATTHRDGWMFLYTFVSLMTIFTAMALAFDKERA